MLNMFRQTNRERARESREVSESVKSKKEVGKISKKEWAGMVKEEEPKGMDLHVYNFLVTEGHFDIAKTFA